MGVRRGYLGVSFVLADWQVRVFWSSGIVDRPSDCLYIRIILISGCTYRLSRYIPFSYQALLAYYR